MPNQREAPLCLTCGTKMRPAGSSFVFCENCGRTQQMLQFMEFTKEMIKVSSVMDINRLLPQLSSSAQPCTDTWLRYMLDSGTKLFVALDDYRIIGTVLLVPMVGLVGQKDWIEDVVVDQNYRRRGIATVLMEMAHEVSRDRGAKSINLTSKPDRGGARQMYGDMGYELRDTGVFRLPLR